MSIKWGHPVATLPVTVGTIRHIRRGRKFCESPAFERSVRVFVSCYRRFSGRFIADFYHALGKAVKPDPQHETAI
eukprot:1718679-Pleurochrysis_carterae.AAC.1